jgi:hypothetical protein
MVDSTTSLLISSIVINILLVIERFLKRITKSKCCGSELTLEPSKSSIDLHNIKISDNSNELSTNETARNNTLHP